MYFIPSGTLYWPKPCPKLLTASYWAITEHSIVYSEQDRIDMVDLSRHPVGSELCPSPPVIVDKLSGMQSLSKVTFYAFSLPSNEFDVQYVIFDRSSVEEMPDSWVTRRGLLEGKYLECASTVCRRVIHTPGDMYCNEHIRRHPHVGSFLHRNDV